MRAHLLTLAIGAAGGGLFAVLALPLPWLLGALVFNLAASLLGVGLRLDARVRRPSLAVLGVAIGASLSPDLLVRARDWWISLTGIALFLLAAAPLAIAYYRRVARFDRISAIYAGVPGGLSEMIMTGSALGGDARRIALAHSSRLAIILLLIAPAMQWLTGVDVSAVPGDARVPLSLSWTDAAILLGCAVVGATLGVRIKLPNAMLLGPLIISAAVHLLELTSARVPGPLLDVVQLLVGAYIGAQFAETRLRDLLRMLLLATVINAILLVLAGAFAWWVSQIAGLPLTPVLLAFVPGGIAEMGLIALLLDIDPIFVAAHHIFRVLLILLASPLLARFVREA